MVLNPALYAALKQRFGRVKVFTPGAKASWKIILNDFGRYEVKFNPHGGGEQYAVCCPFCGDDRYRLEIGHTWLTTFPRTLEPVVHNLTCFNEECEEVYSEEFRRPFLNFIMGDGQLATIVVTNSEPEAPQPKQQLRMPKGCIPLDALQPGHRALTFLEKKYPGLSPVYLAQQYGAVFTEAKDDLYRLAHERVFFPIFSKGEWAGWQGRSINGSQPKWLLPPGWQKVLYNADRVDHTQVPIICEGITSSICCGPNAIALFGKEIDDAKCKEIADRWSTAVIALDPETSLPDPHAHGQITTQKLKAQLDKYLRVPAYILKWPDEAMRKAQASVEYKVRQVAGLKSKNPIPKEEHPVPDAADYGIAGMVSILAQIPASHRGTPRGTP